MPVGRVDFFDLDEELLLDDFFALDLLDGFFVLDDFLLPVLLDDDLFEGDFDDFFAVDFLVLELFFDLVDLVFDLLAGAFLVVFCFGLLSVCANAEVVKPITSRMASRFFMG